MLIGSHGLTLERINIWKVHVIYVLLNCNDRDIIAVIFINTSLKCLANAITFFLQSFSQFSRIKENFQFFFFYMLSIDYKITKHERL